MRNRIIQAFSTKGQKEGPKKVTGHTIYNKPKPRQEWIDGHFVKHTDDNEEAWVELFIDLVFVVYLTSLAKMLHACEVSSFNVFRTAVYFVTVCTTRQALDEYSNRFYCHDMVQKLTYLVYTVGVFVQVFSLNIVSVDIIKPVEHAAQESFFTESSSSSSGSESAGSYTVDGCAYVPFQAAGMAFGVLTTRISLIFIYTVVMYHHPAARRQFSFDMFRWALTSLIMIFILVLHSKRSNLEYVDICLLGIAVILEVFVWIISRAWFRPWFKFPINLETLQLRWGVWIMIVIGESVIQMLERSLYVHRIYNVIAFMIAALVLMFSLAMQYYDACQAEWFEHALTKSGFGGISWVWLHLPLSYCLFRVGIFFNFMIEKHAGGHHASDVQSFKFSLVMALTTCILTAMRICNTGIWNISRRNKVTYVIRFLISATQFLVFKANIMDPFYLMLLHVCICSISNVVDTVNDFYNSEHRRLQEKSVTAMVAKVFPRHWSKLTVIRTQSNVKLLLGEEGDPRCQSNVLRGMSRRMSSRLLNYHMLADIDENGEMMDVLDLEAAEEDSLHNCGDSIDEPIRSKVVINIEELVRNELLDLERAENHYAARAAAKQAPALTVQKPKIQKVRSSSDYSESSPSAGIQKQKSIVNQALTLAAYVGSKRVSPASDDVASNSSSVAGFAGSNSGETRTKDGLWFSDEVDTDRNGSTEINAIEIGHDSPSTLRNLRLSHRTSSASIQLSHTNQKFQSHPRISNDPGDLVLVSPGSKDYHPLSETESSPKAGVPSPDCSDTVI